MSRRPEEVGAVVRELSSVRLPLLGAGRRERERALVLALGGGVSLELVENWYMVQGRWFRGLFSLVSGCRPGALHVEVDKPRPRTGFTNWEEENAAL